MFFSFSYSFFFHFVRYSSALAEILSVKHMPDGQTKYYVHYIDYNKRLDEWVEKERLNLREIQAPKNDKFTNLSAPLKAGSRSCSPDRDQSQSQTVRMI